MDGKSKQKSRSSTGKVSRRKPERAVYSKAITLKVYKLFRIKSTLIYEIPIAESDLTMLAIQHTQFVPSLLYELIHGYEHRTTILAKGAARYLIHSIMELMKFKAKYRTNEPVDSLNNWLFLVQCLEQIEGVWDPYGHAAPIGFSVCASTDDHLKKWPVYRWEVISGAGLTESFEMTDEEILKHAQSSSRKPHGLPLEKWNDIRQHTQRYKNNKRYWSSEQRRQAGKANRLKKKSR